MLTANFSLAPSDSTGTHCHSSYFGLAQTDGERVLPTASHDGMRLGIVARTFHGIACHILNHENTDAAAMTALFATNGPCRNEIQNIFLVSTKKNTFSAASAFDRVATYLNHGQYRSAYMVARAAYYAISHHPTYLEWSSLDLHLQAAQHLPAPMLSGTENCPRISVA